jgi:hypothetical protein
MIVSRLASALFVSLLGIGVVACGGNSDNPDGNPGDPPDAPTADADTTPDAGPDVPPVFYNPVDMADGPLALAALQRLGAPVTGADNRCNQCHSLTNAHLRRWGDDAAAAYPCIENVNLGAQTSSLAAVECLNELGDEAGIRARDLGAFSAAGRLDFFERLYRVAYQSGNSPEWQAFRDAVPMPTTLANSLDQGEFDVVAEWVLRGQPRLDELVPPDSTGDCTPSITSEVSTRVNALATTGWRAVNEANGLSMYGCAGAATPFDCMNNQPLATERTYSATWDVAPYKLLLLAEMPSYNSAFWTRSSADGRFVGHGGGDGAGGSTIIDLIDDSHIGVDAAYDPGFFPDNSGFMFQGSGRNVCTQNILLTATTSINMDTNPACATVGIGLYQHSGRALGGGDYFTVYGSFVSDDGGFQYDPFADFSAGDTADIRPMIYTGTTWQEKPETMISIPNEGDAIMSPSTQFIVTRKGNSSSQQTAFQLRAVTATPNGPGYDIDAPIVATYCESGGKPAISYDERWMVFHHGAYPNSDRDAIDLGFTGATDPGYAAYSGDVHNIFIVDLLTGARTRITNMSPGQHAFFPHFRSDGWIYFIVKDGGRETVVASDAALHLEAL